MRNGKRGRKSSKVDVEAVGEVLARSGDEVFEKY